MIPGRMFGPYITRDIYTTYNSFYCYESTFEIESVKPEDIGTVYVFVSNEKGHAGAQIQIQLAKNALDQNSMGQSPPPPPPLSLSSLPAKRPPGQHQSNATKPNPTGPLFPLATSAAPRANLWAASQARLCLLLCAAASASLLALGRRLGQASWPDIR